MAGLKIWTDAALQRAVVRRSAIIAFVVGTLLLAINQGDVLLAGLFPAELTWKIPLTYLVPYCVSTFASAHTIVSSESGNGQR